MAERSFIKSFWKHPFQSHINHAVCFHFLRSKFSSHIRICHIFNVSLHYNDYFQFKCVPISFKAGDSFIFLLVNGQLIR